MTTTDAATTATNATTRTPATPRTTGMDIGLLILRIGVGAAILQAGLIKAFDFGTTVGFMESAGWRPPGLAALMVTSAETLGGLGLIFGALTPLAAFAVISAMVDAWAVNVSVSAFWSEPFNVPFLIGIGATALLFAGAGSYSLDAKVLGRTAWGTRIAVGLLVAAFAAALLTWVALLGTNPIHFTAPS